MDKIELLGKQEETEPSVERPKVKTGWGCPTPDTTNDITNWVKSKVENGDDRNDVPAEAASEVE